MKKQIYLYRKSIVALLCVGLFACQTAQKSWVFENPPAQMSQAGQESFNQAVSAQKRGQPDEAIKLWKAFLKQNPNSVQAHNNLGMIYYTEDRLSPSIDHFENALSIEPGNQTVRENMARSLKFQVTLLKENKEYERGIENLKKLKAISPPENHEKILFQMEEMEDAIYHQVEMANTPGKYRAFIRSYPEGLNADKAREKLKTLEASSRKPRRSIFEHSSAIDGTLIDPHRGSIGESFATDNPVETPEISQIDESPVFETPVTEDVPDISSAVTPLESKVNEVSENVLPIEAKPEASLKPLDEPRVEAQVIEKVIERSSRPQVIVRVSANSHLRVRSLPSTSGRITARLKNGEVCDLIKEIPDWFLVRFDQGRSGWISQKYSEKIKSEQDEKNPQVSLNDEEVAFGLVSQTRQRLKPYY